jgi:hypothetical protein
MKTLPRPFGLWRGLSLVAVPAVNAGFVLLCVAWGWPEWWQQINDEDAALSWFSSSQLLVSGLACLAVAFLREAEGAKSPRRFDRLVWPLLACGFFFLSLDERFQIHESLRDGVFAPRGVGAGIPGVRPGDIAIPLYAAGGLAMAARLWALLGRQARLLFGLGVAAAACAVLIDAFSMVGGDKHLRQFVEELFETAAQMSFLTAFVAQFWEHARAVLPAGEGARSRP